MSTLPKNMTTDPAYHRPHVIKKSSAGLSSSAARLLTARPEWFVEENVAALMIRGNSGQRIINGARGASGMGGRGYG
jgi:hypothetical protein